MKLLQTQTMRLLVLITFFSFCFFCAFLTMFVLPENEIQELDHKTTVLDRYEDVQQRTRLMEALIGQRYLYSAEKPQRTMKNLGIKLKEILESSSKNRQFISDSLPDDNYDDIVADDLDEDHYGDLPENDVFADGDFDYENASLMSKNQSFVLSIKKIGNRIVSDVQIKNAQQMFRIKLVESINQKGVDSPIHRTHGIKLRNVSMVNFEGVPVVEDKLFWSKDLEENASKGVSDSEVSSTLNRLRSLQVKRVQPPTWDLCGRPKNLFVVFEDGSKACGRYRAPHQYLVQGEVLSFYLARLLSITNVPVVALVNSNADDDRWSNDQVRNDIRKSGWQSNATVALIQWIDDLERDKMPSLLLSAVMNQSTLHSHTAGLYDLSVKELVELLQWSDLIVFDYLTGNYDRVASMQDAADKEKKPSILNETIHNLVKSRTTNTIWLIDNESGLLDSYSLLYGRLGQDGRFLNFHRQILNSICLFRRTTAERIRWLHQTGIPGRILMEFAKENEPLLTNIDDIDRLYRRLRERVAEVHNHIVRCTTDFR